MPNIGPYLLGGRAGRQTPVCLTPQPLFASPFCLPPPGLDDFHLSIHSDMAAIVKAMASPESGLEVRDRMWLKITIPNAFIGERPPWWDDGQGGE